MIGKKLKQLREKRGMTQAQLGRKADVTLVSISRYENDKNFPSPQVMEKISDALNVHISFFTEDPEPFDVSAEEIEQLMLRLRGLIVANPQRRKVVGTLISSLIMKYSNQKIPFKG